MRRDVPDEILNRRFGPYVLLRELGCGGMAQVYLCALPCSPKVARFFALKCIHGAYNGIPEYVRLFYHEAEIALRLHHANIVETWSCGVIEGRHTLAMDYLCGQPVSALIARGHLSLEIALWIAVQALDGLEYLHEKCDILGTPLEIVHRDLTPDNIYVGYDGTVKIFDFGVSKCGGDADEIQNGMMVGKYAYMSPEQCRGEAVDARSDLFSLAAVLYEMCMGYGAFHRDSDIATIDAVVQGKVVAPNAQSWRFPSFLSQVIMRGLASDKSRRYESARWFADDLRMFVKMQGWTNLKQKCQDHMKNVFAQEIDGEFEFMKKSMHYLREFMPKIEELETKGAREPQNLSGSEWGTGAGSVTFSKLV